MKTLNILLKSIFIIIILLLNITPIQAQDTCTFTLGNDTTFCGSGILTGPSIGLWNTGDSTQSITVTTSGTYWLEISDSICTYRDSVNVIVGTIPAIIDYMIYTTDLSVQFVATDTTNDLLWNFGDGTTSTEKLPTHTYNNIGIYDVSLTVIDTTTKCKTDPIKKTIGVGYDCIADFTETLDTMKIEAYLVEKSIVGVATNMFWKLGDGKSSNRRSVKNTYQPGIYQVEITTYNIATGCMDTKQKVLDLLNTDDCLSEFTVETIDKQATFTSTSIGTITSYLWDFGDGKTSTETNPTHNYAKEKYYSVCLTIQTNMCQNTSCQTITIGKDNGRANFDFVITDEINNTVTFINNSSGNDISYIWEFDDGTTSTEINPIHSYSQAGFYNVTLRIPNPQGHIVSQISKIVPIKSSGIKGKFTATNDTAIVSKKKSIDYPVSFQGSLWGNPSKFIWNFGDGTIDSTQINPTHLYSQQGEYEVCLSIYRPLIDEYDSFCDTILVEDLLTDIQRSEIINKFSIYPNPAKEIVNIKSENPVDVKVFDLAGKLLITKSNLIQDIISVSDLKKGLYLIVIQSENNIKTSKLIKE